MKILAIIPARSGSKGLPNKNILPLDGTPLISWTIQAAQLSKIFSKIIVSTDSEEICKIAIQWGAEVPFLRPEELSTDKSPIVDTIIYLLRCLDDDYDGVCLLQPTSPLRGANHIIEAFELFKSSGAPSVVSITELEKSPQWSFWRDQRGRLTPLLTAGHTVSRRQDLKSAYVLNGAIYFVKTEFFVKEKKFYFEDSVSYLMNKESSIDIDNLIDFKLAQLLIGEL